MARRKRFLTEANRRKIHSFLKSYLLEVFSGEECMTSFREAYEEAERVEVYGARKYLTPSLVADWLRGLPLNVAYMTHDIVCMLLEAVTGSGNYGGMGGFMEDDVEIDCFYWDEMGRIIYQEGGAVWD